VILKTALEQGESERDHRYKVPLSEPGITSLNPCQHPGSNPEPFAWWANFVGCEKCEGAQMFLGFTVSTNEGIL
jgi:hypothetical protein